MLLKSLSLINYKNFSDAVFEFDAKINCLVGRNGVGKTNVLDAIYHLAYGKSYFNPMAVQNIRHGEDFFVIDGHFEIGQRPEQIVCSLKKNQKKILKRNGRLYEKFSDHIGLIPVVIISPADRDLIVEGSETRRQFADSVISQSDAVYLQQLIQYQKIIQQRNALLKYFALNQAFEYQTLEIYNEQLHELGHEIHQKRADFIAELVPIFEKYYQKISGSSEQVQLRYQSQLSQGNLRALLEESIAKDRLLQYTGCGIHKDDLLFEIDGHPIKKFGSQGQQKSFLIALKLAQFEFVQAHLGTQPILLFDDIFDKLDEHRVTQIIAMVNQDEFGQLFISDTHAERTEQVVQETLQSYKMFRL